MYPPRLFTKISKLPTVRLRLQRTSGCYPDFDLAQEFLLVTLEQYAIPASLARRFGTGGWVSEDEHRSIDGWERSLVAEFPDAAGMMDRMIEIVETMLADQAEERRRENEESERRAAMESGL